MNQHVVGINRYYYVTSNSNMINLCNFYCKCSWTAITQLVHHGMLYVPIGYTFGAGMFEMDSIRGGTPYGAGTYAGDGSRQATEAELALAEYQGRYMANIVKKLGQKS